MIGNKPLGAPSVLREDSVGAYYEVPLFDSSYVNDLKPAIRSGQLGASFRFKVTGEEWVTPDKSTVDNPARLDERTITAVDLYEFGPVTFPAYADASAGLRSRTDEFMQHFLDDPAFLARFIDQVGARAAVKILADLPARSPLTSAQFEPQQPEPDEDPEPDDVDPDAEPDEPADGGETESKGRRQEWFERTTAAFDDHIQRLERAHQS
jgi:hypothetical protein